MYRFVGAAAYITLCGMVFSGAPIINLGCTFLLMVLFSSLLREEGVAVTVETLRHGPRVCTVNCTNQWNRMTKR